MPDHPSSPFARLPDPAQFRFNPKFALGILGAIILVTGALTCAYQVPANSVAVVQRFGAWLKNVGPGLNFRLPFGVDSITIVEVQRQLKLEFGYSTPGNTNPYQSPYSRDDLEGEKNMVTGDLNAVVVEWVVQYHIADPQAYVFEFREPPQTLRDLSQAVMREVVGDRSVDEVLTIGRQEMETVSLDRLQQLVADLKMGIHIDQVQLRNVNPPPPVQMSFDEVNKAQQEKEQMINKATGDYNREVPKARGEADQVLSAAEGYATRRVNEAEGDTARFNSILTEYLKAPEVTRRRLYLETMAEILSATPGKVILDDKAANFIPHMALPDAAAPQGR
ncbi:MAG: FtsH protease activity modulator HflK [Verrucomicrobiaceae bacterium]|nr:FtsH protease activity modulator HflK [Verrucomicrobiaceae bacterium]